jgi:5-methylcytosine-specific restriction endonuclease McrA
MLRQAFTIMYFSTHKLMRLKRTIRQECLRTGGQLVKSIRDHFAGPDRCLDDYTRRPKLNKVQRAERRRRRRALAGYTSTQPAPTPRLALNDPERWRLYAEVLAIGYCQCCRSRRQLTVDHIVPLVLGGGNHLGNLQCLCEQCNKAKNQQIWAAPLPRLAQAA